MKSQEGNHQNERNNKDMIVNGTRYLRTTLRIPHACPYPDRGRVYWLGNMQLLITSQKKS